MYMKFHGLIDFDVKEVIFTGFRFYAKDNKCVNVVYQCLRLIYYHQFQLVPDSDWQLYAL